MMFLLGMQAMFGQDPPIYLRSITATRCPCAARVHAVNFDPAPLPRITTSYSSGSVFVGDWAEEAFAISLFPDWVKRAFPSQRALKPPWSTPPKLTPSLHPAVANRMIPRKEPSPSSGKQRCPPSRESRRQTQPSH